MLKKFTLLITGILVLCIALLFGYAAFQSPDYVISREIKINASAEKIFPYLNNQRLAQEWGPWLEVDPTARMTLIGPEAGVGSRTSWSGAKQLGTGSALVTESVTNQRVHIRLEYTEPTAMTQESDYIIAPAGDQSLVTWRVTGKNSLLGRAMCLVIDMDKMVGGMFEQGLNKLKKVVENPK